MSLPLILRKSLLEVFIISFPQYLTEPVMSADWLIKLTVASAVTDFPDPVSYTHLRAHET